MIRYANVWVPAQAYYAVFAGLLAWLRASRNQASSHVKVLAEAGRDMARISCTCVPWSVVCKGCPQTRDEEYLRLDSSADLTISNLSSARDDPSVWGLLAKCLKTTRRDSVERALKNWKRENRRKALKPEEKVQVAAKVAPTSLFDFFYAMRIRTNYEGSDAFALGPWTELNAKDFYRDVLQLTSATLRFVEILITGRIGKEQFLKLLQAFKDDSQVDPSDILPLQFWSKL